VSLLDAFFERQNVVVLDGGLATELEARGHDLGDALWSARLLLDNPAAIREVHRDYLDAGADCIVSASYQATIEGFRSQGLDPAEAEDLLRRSVLLACEARDEFWSRADRSNRLRPLVAASIGPYGAYLADGSEYRGTYDVDEKGLVEFHRHRWEILSDSPADLLACETLPSTVEARALSGLLEATPGKQAWFSFSCRDGAHVSDGSRIADAARMLDCCAQVVAIGVNCTAPWYIPELIGELRAATGKPIVVYPNSGETYDAAGKRWLPGEQALDLGRACQEWRSLGARLIGGCCRTGPAQIRLIRDRAVA